MRVHVDRSVCQGHGRCYGDVPGAFEADEEGYAVVVQAEVPSELQVAVLRALRACPERAIEITPEGTERSRG